MLSIALYSRKYHEPQQFTDKLISHLSERGNQLFLHENIYTGGEHRSFSGHDTLRECGKVDFMVSVGGDGSFIDAANIVGDLGIPLVGINTGRIGFLSAIRKDDFARCFEMLENGEYRLEQRSLLHVEGSEPLGLATDFVVNDVTVRATDTDSINAITVSTADGQRVNTYWADGLIIATPTGSTAYSMSCGGPILHPLTDVTVLTPIASHSLSVRPLVIPASQSLRIDVDGRGGKYSLCVDTQRIIVGNNVSLFVSKEKFSINTVLFNGGSFYSTIREKLLWGLDKRNA